MHIATIVSLLAIVTGSCSSSSSEVNEEALLKDYSIVNTLRWSNRDRSAIGYSFADCVTASDKQCVDSLVARYGAERVAQHAFESIKSAVASSDIDMMRYLLETFDSVYRTKGMMCRPFIVESGARYASTPVFTALLTYYENYPRFEEEPLMWALRYSVLANRLDNVSHVIQTYNSNPGFKQAVASTMSWAIGDKTSYAGMSVLLDYIEPRLNEYDLALQWTVGNGMYESSITMITYVLDRLHARPDMLQKHLCKALQKQSWSESTTIIDFLAKRYSAEYLARGWRGLLILSARRGRQVAFEAVIKYFLVPHPELAGQAVAFAHKSALRHKHKDITAALLPFVTVVPPAELSD